MSRFRLLLPILIAIGIGLVASGCGGGTAAPSEGAGVFITRVLSEELHGHWARQWTELHPGHQKLISQRQYVACSRELGTNIATGEEIFRVLAVEDQKIQVCGVPEHTAKLVTINVRQPGQTPGLTYRLHAVGVGSRWTWILGPRFLDSIAHGRCLDGSKLGAANAWPG